jgi:hypothetical protein
VRKSAKKSSTAYDERWFLRNIKNNPKLNATKLAAEIGNRVLIPDTIRRLSREKRFSWKSGQKKKNPP